MKLAPAVAITLLVIGCSEPPITPFDSSTNVDPASYSWAQSSGCHSVRLTTQTEGNFPNFVGTLTGNLEGDVQVRLGFDGINGIVFNNPGVETWMVTGGTIQELIGATITSEFDAVQPFAPGQAPNSIINGHSVVVSGAQRGRLTFHGGLTPGAPSHVNLEYHGVICP